MSRDPRLKFSNGSGCPMLEVWHEASERREELEQDFAEVHSAMNVLKANVVHLAVLPELAKTIEDLKENLVAPATGRKQVPIIAHLMMLGILGIIIAVLLLKDSDKNLHIDANGIHLEQKKTTP